MKNIGLILIIIAIICGAVFLGGWLVTIGIVLFKIMIGLLGICLLVAGFYLGRWTKK